ncbi:Uncharacterised protein [Halioglobus japonicus]|nr:Uncharacterised protein [Halioglobus japonicus]
MTRIFLAFILTMTAASAGAANWPWQDPAQEEPPEYCKGFVVGGLASREVSGMSRTDLWLAWSYVTRSGIIGTTIASPEFQSGLGKFQTVADSTAANTLVEDADGNCGLGRSGLEITGW